jgi:glycosyltransferase involved in cell wall biosynthesis
VTHGAVALANPAHPDEAGARDQHPLFCIIDPSLRDFAGHHFSYDEAAASGAAKAGFEPVILAHREVDPAIAGRVQLVRCFKNDMWSSSPMVRRLPTRARERFEIHLANRTFSRDLRRGLKGLRLLPGSVLFAHMIFRHQLPALARFVDEAPYETLTVILLFRYQTAFYDNPPCHRAFRMLERANNSGRRVRLASDSDRLAREFGRLTSLPFEVMPIPHTSDSEVVRPPQRPGVRFVSLGGARDEKGYIDILNAIRMLRAEKDLEGMEFVLQSSDARPEIEAVTEEFAREDIPNVSLLRQTLSPEQYAGQLSAADVVLVPYWRDIYSARTSGIFLEAVAAGKPVIATRDTWMSDELERYGSGLLVEDHDARSIAEAMRTAVRNKTELQRRAESSRLDCLAIHNPASLIRQITDGASRYAARGRNVHNVAIFYPWGDFLQRTAGASQRVNMLAEMLAPHVNEIRVLQGGPIPATRQGKLFVEGQALRRRQIYLRRLFRLVFRVRLGRTAFGQELLVWFHLERRVDPLFRRKVEELVRWADVVLLEYSFWGSVVLPACRRAGRMCILTNHDILSEQVIASSLLRRLTWRFERASLEAADAVVAVSPDDQRVLAASGITAHLIQNPVDMDRLTVTVPGDPREFLRELYDIDLPSTPFGLFVGSLFTPNVVAVNRLREMAPAMPDMHFVVAGGVAEPTHAGNFRALGKVEHAALVLLYRAANVVLIPLPHGTGSSIKTLEAMASGLPVMGTSAAFRGLAIDSGNNCILEDDLTRWPQLVRDLLASHDRTSALGVHARRFAEAHDFRKVFVAYFALLGMQVELEQNSERDAMLRGVAYDRLVEEIFVRLDERLSGSAKLLLSLLLSAPLEPRESRDDQVRYAFARSVEQRQFALAGRLLQLAEMMTHLEPLRLQAAPEFGQAAEVSAHRAATDRLLREMFSKIEGEGNAWTELAMQLLLDEPVAPAGAREGQVRRALIATFDQQQFALAHQILRLAEGGHRQL